MNPCSVAYKGKKLYFYTLGEGEPILLIHGYLADSNIWDGFAHELAKTFRVIMIDLPGHGNSVLSSSVNKMDYLAEAVHQVMHKLDLEKANLLGHSLGGYVALALLQKYPEKVQSAVLLNSHPWNDSADKIELRDKEAKLIEEGKLELLVKFNIANNFAGPNRDRLSKTIKKLEAIALSQPEPGILSMLRGMKYREDRSEVLTNCSLPICIILGKEDPRIDAQKMQKEFDSKNHISLSIVSETGHLTMLEKPEETLGLINDFLRKENK